MINIIIISLVCINRHVHAFELRFQNVTNSGQATIIGSRINM